MKVAEVVDDIKVSLGSPVVKVYSKDEMIERQVTIAWKKFSSTVFKQEYRTLPFESCIQLDPSEIVYVTDVKPDIQQSNTRANIYKANEFTLYEAQRFFDTRWGGLEGPVLSRIVSNQLDKTFDSQFDWKYDRHTGKLYIVNMPQGCNFVNLEVRTRFSIDDIPQEAEDWFLAYSLALTKLMEGRIRNKFKDTVPGSPQDGDDLIQEGQQEKETLEETVNDFVSYNFGSRY